MDFKVALLLLLFIVVLVCVTMLTIPKGGRTKEDIEREKERLEEKTTSVGQWFVYHILLSLPVINILLLLVLAFKKYETNTTVKNWARSQLIICLAYTIILVGSIIFVVVMYKDQITTFLEQYNQVG